MITQLSTYDIVDQLMGAEAFGTDDISYQACSAMANYLERLEEDIGEPMELDPIGIRCEFSIYTLNEMIEQYSYSFPDLTRENVLGTMRENTTVINLDDDYYIMGEF